MVHCAFLAGNIDPNGIRICAKECLHCFNGMTAAKYIDLNHMRADGYSLPIVTYP